MKIFLKIYYLLLFMSSTLGDVLYFYYEENTSINNRCICLSPVDLKLTLLSSQETITTVTSTEYDVLLNYFSLTSTLQESSNFPTQFMLLQSYVCDFFADNAYVTFKGVTHKLGRDGDYKCHPFSSYTSYTWFFDSSLGIMSFNDSTATFNYGPPTSNCVAKVPFVASLPSSSLGVCSPNFIPSDSNDIAPIPDNYIPPSIITSGDGGDNNGVQGSNSPPPTPTPDNSETQFAYGIGSLSSPTSSSTTADALSTINIDSYLNQDHPSSIANVMNGDNHVISFEPPPISCTNTGRMLSKTGDGMVGFGTFLIGAALFGLVAEGTILYSIVAGFALIADGVYRDLSLAQMSALGSMLESTDEGIVIQTPPSSSGSRDCNRYLGGVIGNSSSTILSNNNMTMGVMIKGENLTYVINYGALFNHTTYVYKFSFLNATSLKPISLPLLTRVNMTFNINNNKNALLDSTTPQTSLSSLTTSSSSSFGSVSSSSMANTPSVSSQQSSGGGSGGSSLLFLTSPAGLSIFSIAGVLIVGLIVVIMKRKRKLYLELLTSTQGIKLS